MDRGNANGIPAYYFNVSHELRNALSIMMASCMMASRHIDDKDRALECLERIYVAGEKITELLDDTLEISKFRQGKMELKEHTFSINNLREELIELLEPLAEDKNINLNISAKKYIDIEVLGDYGRLLQVMVNLATNSIKYTPEGGNIDIHFEGTKAHDPQMVTYICTCQDDGIGIPESFLQNIFEPFARADDERVSKIKGTGLGMAIVKETIEAMDGSINIDSIINKGTPVTIHLKFRKNIRKG